MTEAMLTVATAMPESDMDIVMAELRSGHPSMSLVLEEVEAEATLGGGARTGVERRCTTC